MKMPSCDEGWAMGSRIPCRSKIKTK